MRFTGALVVRGAVLLIAPDKTAFKRLPVPLARCDTCGCGARVLPAEMLPGKTYTLPVIEVAALRYTSPDPAGPGLRRVVLGMGRYAPAHSSLHRWATGIGERALDRAPAPAPDTPPHATPPHPPSAAALLAETARRLDPHIFLRWNTQPAIPPWKHWTERRRDQLQACARVLAAAQHLFPAAPSPLTEWQSHLARFLGVTGWTFRTGPRPAPMQRGLPAPPALDSDPHPETPVGVSPHGSRAPPHRRFPL